jgi:hypothetical protein
MTVTYWYEGSNNVVSGTAVTMASGDYLYVAQNVTVGSSGSAHGIDASAGNITADIYGAVFSVGGTGLFTADNNCAIVIGAGGSVSGGLQGISVSDGTGNSVVNGGTITSAGGEAVFFGGAAGSLVNTGEISAGKDNAVYMNQDGNMISNSGTIASADKTAIFLNSGGDDFVNVIDNSGTISSASGFDAIIMGSGTGSLTNSGHITGNVDFQGAASVTNQGTIEGGVTLGTVADTTDTIDNSGTIAASATGVGAIVDIGTGMLDVTNKGDVAGGSLGIAFDAASGTDNLVNSGTISGSAAAVTELNNGALSVTNSGEIHGGQFAVLFATTVGVDTLDNTGIVTGSQNAVDENGSADLNVVNSGTISGTTAIVFNGVIDTLNNSGTIRSNVAGSFAVAEIGGSLDIANSGHIDGGIDFSGGSANIYDGTLGSVTGWVTGGSGTNTFTGGAGTDHFDGGTGVSALDGMGGNDVLMAEGVKTTIDGGDGNDTIAMSSFFTAADLIDGGAGNDQLTLNGNYAAGVTLGSDTLVNVEKIVLDAGFNYNLTTDDATVAAGARLTVDASALGAGQELTFNGSAETDGHFLITGGAANDVLIGGAGNDTLIGGGDNNKFTGGLGADHIIATYAEHDSFIYNDVNDSTGLAHDVITDFSATVQTFDLDVTVTGINSEITSGKLTAANFDANLATAVSATHLAAGHAVLFAPTTGSFAGHTFLIVDANGVAGYQAGQDYVFDLVTAAHLNQLATSNFI